MAVQHQNALSDLATAVAYLTGAVTSLHGLTVLIVKNLHDQVPEGDRAQMIEKMEKCGERLDKVLDLLDKVANAPE